MISGKKIPDRKAGILLLAHGSTEPGVEAEAQSLRRKLARAAHAPGLYALAWLNRKPSLLEGVDSLVQKGCREVEILPLLVFRGKHLQQDIPVLIAEARHRHPGLKMTLQRHITGMPGFARWFAGESKSPSTPRRRS